MSINGKRLVFIGPMGSGKSSLARRVSAQYGGDVFDTDREFVRRYGDIKAFFERKGEAEFRKIETELLREAADSTAAYIATGGGAVLDKRGMCALRAKCDVVYLSAPVSVLESRIKNSNRPLKGKLSETLKARAPLYEKYADYIIDTSVDSVSALLTALETPRKNRYDVILCDADDTLLDFRKAMRHAVIAAVRGECDCSASDDAICAAYSAITDEVWSELERGEITRAELNAARFVMLKERLGADFSPERTNARYVPEMQKTRFTIDGAKEFLDAARARGVKVYIITNSFAHIASQRLKALDGHHDGAFISENVGYDKPDVRFFARVCEAVGAVDKNRILVFGDGENSDISGGIAYGVDTCLFDRHGKNRATAADYRACDFDRVLKII